MQKVKIDAGLALQISGFILGKLEAGRYDTQGTAKIKQKARARVLRWAMDFFKGGLNRGNP